MKQAKMPEWRINRIKELRIHVAIAVMSVIAIVSIALTFFCIGRSTVQASEADPTLTAGFAEAMRQDFSDLTIEESEPEVVEESYQPYSDYDLELMAHLLYAEVGSDAVCDTTIYYVGSVLLNRVADDRYPDTIEGCIYQQGQYSTAGWMMYQEPSDRCYEIAEELLIYGSVLPENVLGQAQFAQMDQVYCEMDGEIFSIWY